jgi:type II secretory pathway pseudopilin PulG
MVNVAMLEQKPLEGFDIVHDTVAPRKFEAASRDVDRFFRHKSPYRLLAAIAIPNFTKAEQTTVYNQTLVNEAQIACALERYRLAHGGYPETPGALSPQFIESLPHDLIGGEPLIYRRTADGKFLLYSVGWNETDDGGVTVRDKSGNEDKTKGDWVWQCPVK